MTFHFDASHQVLLRVGWPPVNVRRPTQICECHACSCVYVTTFLPCVCNYSPPVWLEASYVLHVLYVAWDHPQYPMPSPTFTFWWHFTGAVVLPCRRYDGHGREACLQQWQEVKWTTKHVYEIIQKKCINPLIVVYFSKSTNDELSPPKRTGNFLYRGRVLRVCVMTSVRVYVCQASLTVSNTMTFARS